jgi:hypothetical protein
MQENSITAEGVAVPPSTTNTTTSAPATPPSTNATEIDQAQFEADKRAVYK